MNNLCVTSWVTLLVGIFLCCSCKKETSQQKQNSIQQKDLLGRQSSTSDGTSDLNNNIEKGLEGQQNQEIVKNCIIVLKDFVTADKPEKRLSKVINPEEAINTLAGEAWEEFYSKIDLLKLTIPESISDADVERGIIHMFLSVSSIPTVPDTGISNEELLSTELKRAIKDTTGQDQTLGAVVFFKQLESGEVKLDWSSIAESAADKFAEFLKNPKLGTSSRLRVNIKRSLYSDKKEYEAILVQAIDGPPIDGIRFTFPIESNIASILNKKLPWQVPSMSAVIQLSWVTDPSDSDKLTLALSKIYNFQLPGLGAEIMEPLSIENCVASPE